MINDLAHLSRQERSSHNNRLVIIGSLVADLIIQIDQLSLEQIGWQLASNYFFNPGGVATTALALGKLGCSVAMASWVGKDGIGTDLEKYLKPWPIDLSCIVHLPSSTTMIVQMIDSTDKHSRIILRGNSFIDQLPNEWKEILSQSSIVYLTGFACIELPLQLVQQLMNFVIDRKAKLVFDPQPALPRINPDLLRLILSHTNTLTLNEDEAKDLAQIMSHSENALDLSYLHIPTVFLRQGKRGVTVVYSDRTDFFPAFAVTVRNTLGAGDCFNAAILFGLTHHLSISQTAVLGNALSGIKVSKIGTSSGTPSYDELFSFLNDRGQGDLATVIKGCISTTNS